MNFPSKIDITADDRHLNAAGEIVVTQHDSAVEFLVRFITEPTTALPEGVTFILTSLHLRKPPSQKLGQVLPDNTLRFLLGMDELDTVGEVQANVQAFHPTEGRLTTKPFTYHVAADPLSGAAIKPIDKSLFEQVIGEGPGVITQAKAEILLTASERNRLTGAVGGALNSLAEDKEGALTELATAKTATEEATLEAVGKAEFAEVRGTFAKDQGDFAKLEGEKATAAAQLANEEAEAARLQKEEVVEILGAGPVASINGKTGIVTGIATQQSVDQVNQQLAETVTEMNRYFNQSSYVPSTVKDAFAGSTSIIKTYSTFMEFFAILNTGNADLSFEINGDKITVPVGFGYENPFDKFSSVRIAATSSFLADVRGRGEAVGTDTTPPIVTATPDGGSFMGTQNVVLTANETSDIYYTLDGTEPTQSSNLYTSPLVISSATTLKFFAKDMRGNISIVQTKVFSPLPIISHYFVKTSERATLTTSTTANWKTNGFLNKLNAKLVDVQVSSDGSPTNIVLWEVDSTSKTFKSVIAEGVLSASEVLDTTVNANYKKFIFSQPLDLVAGKYYAMSVQYTSAGALNTQNTAAINTDNAIDMEERLTNYSTAKPVIGDALTNPKYLYDYKLSMNV